MGTTEHWGKIMKIDKGIPVPPGKGNGITGKFAETAKQMEIGDSVGGLSGKEQLALQYALRNAYQKKEWVALDPHRRRELKVMNKVHRYKVQDDGTYRVWRVDMPTKYAELKIKQIQDYHMQKTGNKK